MNEPSTEAVDPATVARPRRIGTDGRGTVLDGEPFNDFPWGTEGRLGNADRSDLSPLGPISTAKHNAISGEKPNITPQQ